MLNVQFFNQLLQYRTACEQRQDSYRGWYDLNFNGIQEILERVEQNLRAVFGEDQRIGDLWLDVPKESENQYID